MKQSFGLPVIIGSVISSAICLSAFAQDASVKAVADIQSRFSLMDTSTENAPYFAQNIIRLGGTLHLDKIDGKVLLQFTGNNAGVNADPGSVGLVGVREAWLSYHLIDEPKEYALTASLGRLLPKGAKAYGTDPTLNYWSSVGNFSSTDGIALNASMQHENINIEAQVIASTSLAIKGFDNNDTMTAGLSNIGAADSALSGKRNNDSMAFIGNLHLNDQINSDWSAEADAAYGMKKNSQISTIIPGTAATPAIETNFKADMAYIEASTGVHYKSLGLGLWYSNLNLSNASAVSPNTDSKENANTPVDVSTQYQTMGIGFQGDSSIFGLQNLLTKNDVLTYGIGAQVMSKTGQSKDTKDNDSYLIGAGAGYTTGIFTASLNYAYFSAKNSVFQKSDTDTDKSAQNVYLMTSVAL